MQFLRLAVPVLCLSAACFADLTPEQKVADFTQLAGLYAVNYAPYEWKVSTFNFDLLNVKTWLDQVRQSKDDLEFYDICVRYVASLHDNHDEYLLPASYSASLHLSVDLWDGKPIIEAITRSYLPLAKYPFVIGDQLISIDGKSAEDMIQSLLPYAVNGHGNPLLEKRIAARYLTLRSQTVFPRAAEIGDSATVVIQRQNGNTETYTIPWDKTGVPIVHAGIVPGLRTSVQNPEQGRLAKSRRMEAPQVEALGADEESDPNPWGVSTDARVEPVAAEAPSYMKPFMKLRNMQASAVTKDAVDFGRFTPVFNPPAGFRTRLGTRITDEFLSGTFPLGTSTIGFIRIPGFVPNDLNTAVNQFASEMVFFQANTDALVVDVMHNGGGDPCYAQDLAALLIPHDFKGPTVEIRATLGYLQGYALALAQAQQQKADQWIIDSLNAYIAEIQQALSENRGRTGSLPVCDVSITVSPLKDTRGRSLAYTKPVVLLTDLLSFSAADLFPALLQDAQRVTIYGERTAGAGGGVVDIPIGDYSEGTTRVTEDLITRAQPIQNPGFPASLYVENTGVVPDVAANYLSMDNLLNGGKTFVNGFLDVLNGLVAPK